jgi:hypothetical protein
MSQNIRDLEQDIEQSRARLDLTIDRLQGKIQDKLTVSGMVDDLLGRGRQSRYAAVYDQTLAVIKRNPIPVMLIAAGVGWLIHRMSTEGERRMRRYVSVRPPDRGDTAPLPAEAAPRIYDPGTAPRRPAEATLDGRSDPGRAEQLR